MSFDPKICMERDGGVCEAKQGGLWIVCQYLATDGQQHWVRDAAKYYWSVDTACIRNIPPKLPEKVCLVITPGEMRSIRQGECRPCAVATDIAGIREQYASFPGDIILEVPVPKEMPDAK